MRLPTSGPHFFAPVEDGAVVLDGEDSHHLARVLRAHAGTEVSLADGTGGVYQARVTAVDPAEVRLEVTASWEAAEARPRLVVVHGLPKGRKLDDVVQRLSEVGVDRLVPVHTVRSEARLDATKADRAVQRWRAVALAAAKQSRRARVMEIGDVDDWEPAFRDATTGVVLWEESTAPLRALLPDLGKADEVTLGIGPEGGLTEEEAAAPGLPIASLGDTILRTETAALVAATITLAAVGRLG